MAITDELREYTEEQIKWLDMTKVHYRKLFAIADRIDAEHHAAIRRWQQEIDALRDELREAVRLSEDKASDMVELPKDADGEYIRIGDVMEFSRFDIDCPVTREVDGVGVGVFFAWCGERGYEQLDAGSYSHHHKPTVEDLLREFVSEFNRDDTELCDEEIIERFAAKLRLAESEES